MPNRQYPDMPQCLTPQKGQFIARVEVCVAFAQALNLAIAAQSHPAFLDELCREITGFHQARTK